MPLSPGNVLAEHATLSVRTLGILALREVEQGASTRDAVHGLLADARPSHADRALATEMVYGAERRRGSLDHLILRAAQREITRIDTLTRAALRLGVYQLVWMPGVQDYAAVYETVAALKQLGGQRSAGFANAVLREVQRHRSEWWPPVEIEETYERLAVEYSYPSWLVRLWVDRFGLEQARTLLEYGNQPPPLVLRVNRLRTTAIEALHVIKEQGNPAIQVRLSNYLSEALVLHGEQPDALPGWDEGWYQVQSESSQIAGRAVSPRAGERVLEIGAAPGGKTTQLAELMDDRGRLIANDVDRRRLMLVTENAHRLGLSSVETLACDARRLPPGHTGFDRVLIDAPCSGLGILNRRPEARWRKRPGDSIKFAHLQGELLDAAAERLQSGGILVYATCTLVPQENQEVVRAFLQRHPDFVYDDLAPFLPPPLRGEAMAGMLEILPQRHGIDGFFIARMRRIDSDTGTTRGGVL